MERERTEFEKEREAERIRLQAERDAFTRDYEVEKTLRAECNALERTCEALNRETIHE